MAFNSASRLKKKEFFTHHSTRQDLAGEHPLGDLGQLLLVIGFVILVGIDVFYMHWFSRIREMIPDIVQYTVGGLCLIFAFILAGRGLHIVFHEIRDPPKVIQHDIFKISRHPIYLGSILAYTAFIIITGSLVALIYFVGVVIFYNYIALDEEKRLLQKFGKEYQAYMKTVRRWIGKKTFYEEQ